MVYTKRAVVFRSSFCVGKRTEKIKYILISQKMEKLTFPQTYSQAVDNFEMRIPNVDNQRQRERCLLEIYTKICE